MATEYRKFETNGGPSEYLVPARPAASPYRQHIPPDALTVGPAPELKPPPRPMYRLEVDGEAPVAQQLKALCRNMRDAREAARARLEAMPEDDRGDMEAPPELTDEEAWGLALASGVKYLESTNGHPPNGVINIRPRNGEFGSVPVPRGTVIRLPPNCVPVGSEIISMEASKSDAPSWDVLDITFGTLTILSQYGDGFVPLASLLYLTRNDLLSPFAHMRTKVDLQVNVSLISKRDDATFEGYRIFVYQEETICAIQTRIEPAHCDHPEVTPILWQDAMYGQYANHGYMGHPGPGPTMPSNAPPGAKTRYRCLRCKREVVRA